jgi:L-lactate dehydrogenase complex protein LldE
VAVVYGRRWPKTAAAFVISNDSSCLMQIQGLLDRQGKKIRTLHLAQVLAPV